MRLAKSLMFRFNRRTTTQNNQPEQLQPVLASAAIENLYIERKAIKHLYLRIDPGNGQVRVSAPNRMKETEIVRFLQQKRDWIARKRQQLQHKVQLSRTLPDSSDRILLWGQPCQLLLQASSQSGITLNGKQELCVQLEDPANRTSLQQQIDRWLRSQISERIEQRLPVWERISGTRAHEWRIRSMKTRWGSCNIRVARIWINQELVKLPPECLDYILLHELVHLLEASHNARFHHLMSRFMPEWPEIDRQLNQYILPR